MAYPVILTPDQVVAPGKWQVLALISGSGGPGVWWWRERLVTSHTLPPPPVDTEARPVAAAWPGLVLVLAAARFS